LRYPKCDCIIIAANRSTNGQSNWNFVYSASNPTGVDKTVFSVVDRQITSASDLTRYPQYSMVLDANQAGKSAGNGNGDGTTSPSNSSSGDGDGGGLSGFWIAFIVIVCIILCLLCITCIVLAIVLVKKRSGGGRGFGRRGGRKPLNDQQYENLGSYSPPDL